MTDDEIIDIALHVGFVGQDPDYDDEAPTHLLEPSSMEDITEMLLAFARRLIKVERMACAELAEAVGGHGAAAARAIRARGFDG